MLKFLTCECGAAEPLARQAAQQAGIVEWMSIPIHKGKEHCLTVLDRFPEPFKKLLAFQALVSMINERGGSFVVVVGYDDEYFYWGDISSGSPSDIFDAAAILKRFA